MLKAMELKRKGFGGDSIYEVKEEDAVIGTINDTRYTLELGGQDYKVERRGFFGPEFRLKSGDAVVAAAKQKPMFNYYRLSYNEKEWTFKAVNMLAKKFGLFSGETQVGSAETPTLMNKLGAITADLPAELPREVRLFLLALAISAWNQQGS